MKVLFNVSSNYLNHDTTIDSFCITGTTANMLPNLNVRRDARKQQKAITLLLFIANTFILRLVMLPSFAKYIITNALLRLTCLINSFPMIVPSLTPLYMNVYSYSSVNYTIVQEFIDSCRIVYKGGITCRR